MVAVLWVLLAAQPVTSGWSLKLPHVRMPWQKPRSPPPVSRAVAEVETCEANPATCAAQGAPVTVSRPIRDDDPLGLVTAPAFGEFVIDPMGLLSPAMAEDLHKNLTKFNRTKGGMSCYLVVATQLPRDDPIVPPRDFAKRLLREWFEKTERVVLILLLAENKRMEVTMGIRARRKLKDSHARRIARKVQQKLPDSMDAAAKQAVKEITAAMTKDKGSLGSLRSMLMPVIVVLVLG